MPFILQNNIVTDTKNNSRVTISTYKCEDGANIEYFVRNYQLLFRLLDNGVTCRLNLN